MFYDILKKIYKDDENFIFIKNNEREKLTYDDKKEKVLFLEGCWEAISKDDMLKINSHKIFFMNMHPNPLYRIPLQPYIDFKTHVKFDKRDIDIFYCGEYKKGYNWVNDNSIVVCEPACWSRLNMIANTLMIKNKNIVMLPQSEWGGKVSKEDYSDMMSRTKIALCPVGSTWESHRIAEAALYGCVIITTPFDSTLYPFGGEVLPDYLRKAPFVFVDRDWKNLPTIIDSLSEEKLYEISQQTLKWANSYVSEYSIIQQVSNLYPK